jgi:hypothetical protein
MPARAVFISAVLILGAAMRLSGGCGYPWTITLTNHRSEGVAVRFCGLWLGCTPHNPQVDVTGNAIRVVFTAAELPCLGGCGHGGSEFDQTVMVPSLAAGIYSMTAIVVNCGQAQVVGTGVGVVGGSAVDVPALDMRGLLTLAILLAVVGVWSLRV